ncbi:MAG: protein translocase subunit SecF [Deltaproteobacteria bacterium]|nr:protein translocase subunit SecF [Deltaproteobacteria bacterium]
MRLIKQELNINFLGLRWGSLSLSAALVILGVVLYFTMGGLRYGIDFTGGTLVQVKLAEQHGIDELRDVMTSSGLGTFSLQSFGEEGSNEFLITLAKSEEEREANESIGGRVENSLKSRFPSLEVRRIETVGPKVGEELKSQALEAVLFSLVAILIYIWIRFQWKYSLGAIVALTHDVLVVLAAFVLTQKEISLPVVAGVLTVAGYSINDTIVIFDRIRENLKRFQKKSTLEVFNESINQTLSRTILTSGTTLFVILSIFLFGGEIINDFAFSLLIGVTIGTYSSIFVASPLVLILMKEAPQKSD